MPQPQAERGHVVLEGGEILVEDLRLQVDGAGLLVPVGEGLGAQGEAGRALLGQELHDGADGLRHLDLLQDVELLVVVGQRPGGAVP